jgi:hypothetical protein
VGSHFSVWFEPNVHSECRQPVHCDMSLVLSGLGISFLVSHKRGLGAIPGQSTWKLWWTEWLWSRFFSKYLVVDKVALEQVFLQVLSGGQSGTGAGFSPST